MRSAATSYALRGGTLSDSLLAGWTEFGPVVQARNDGRLSQATPKGIVPLGIMAQLGEARIVQGLGGPRFLCRLADDGGTWRPSVVGGHAWPARHGAFGSASPLGGGLLVTEDAPGRLHGEQATLFYPGRRTRAVLRGPYELGDEPTQEGLWVSRYVFRTVRDHVANVSRLGLLSAGRLLSSRFDLPFQFAPGELDDSRAWLLGIRTRALHGPNQDLVAVRLRDHAVRTLYEGCARYAGLHSPPSPRALGEGRRNLVAQVPPIGRLFGLRINVDTEGDLEKRIGRGLPSMGGHSGAARAWWDPQRCWVVRVDGFELSPSTRKPEEFLESVSVRALSPGERQPDLPQIRAGMKYGALDSLRPGMSREAAQRSLARWAGRWEKDDFVQTGRATIRHRTNDDVQRFTRWKVALSFGDQGLAGFDLSAD